MTTGPTPERIKELLADLATVGLSPEEELELQSLSAADQAQTDRETLAFERAAAALTEALTPIDEPLPDACRERFRSFTEGAAESGSAQPEPHVPHKMETPGQRLSIWSWGGWLAAAACILIGVSIAVMNSSAPTAPSPSARQAFLADHPDASTAQWTDWALEGVPPEQTGVTGDVVWSEEDQSGYLRLVGLEPNDPNLEQYQLWIVDERGLFDETGQSARISGAIFDASADGETIIRIDPSIPVQNAGAFAITIEKPGGVWVSDMKRRTVIAALGG